MMTVLCGRWRRNRCKVIKCLSGSVVVFNRLLVGDNVTYKKETAGDFSNSNMVLLHQGLFVTFMDEYLVCISFHSHDL